MEDFAPRSAAASRLRKGKKKPEEMDDLGLPPEDEMPVDEAGGTPPDLAALLGGAGDAASGMPPPEGEAGMEGMPMEGGQTDLEMALAGVDSALQGMAPEQAEEIRSHMNAIREIAAGAGASSEPSMEGGAAAAPIPDMENPSQGVIPS